MGNAEGMDAAMEKTWSGHKQLIAHGTRQQRVDGHLKYVQANVKEFVTSH